MARVVKRVKQKTTEVADVLGLIDQAKLEEVKQATVQTISVEDVLRKYKGYVRLLNDEEKIKKYIDRSISNGIICIDTETNNSVEARTAIMVGVCLYTPFRRPVYIPCAHRDKLTRELAPNQISFSFLAEQFQRLIDANVKTVWHNAKFDVNVIDTNCGVRLPIYWDTMVAAKLLDENIRSARLKDLYRLFIEPAQPTYGITSLFEENETADVEKFTLYSAVDPFDTYRLYEFQKKILDFPSMEKVRDLFFNIEMKICEIACEMEQEGAKIDADLTRNYLAYWENLANGYRERINEFFAPIRGKVSEWPINVVSADQTKIALSLMGVSVEDTTAEGLEALAKEFPIASDIVEFRSANHMVTSFFRPLLEQMNPKTGRIHASFNQLGTEDKTIKTGRFSCVQPNLQQLPSFDDSVRLCFDGGITDEEVSVEDEILLYKLDELDTISGRVLAKDLSVGDRIVDLADGEIFEVSALNKVSADLLKMTLKSYQRGGDVNG